MNRPQTYSMPEKLIKNLNEKANELRRSKSSCVQQAVEEWLKRQTKQSEQWKIN